MKRSSGTAVVVLAGLALAAGGAYLKMSREGPPPAASAPAPQAAPSSESSGEAWSDTRPAINQTHIFEGEVNRRGKPVGFHSRPGGHDPQGARLVEIVEQPNRAGVYIADVEIRNGSGRWLRKRSTLYPDRLDRAAVIAAVLHAWNGRTERRGSLFRGPSGEGFTIEGHTLDGGNINTAYPLYDESQ